MEREQYWSDRDRCAWLESVFACLVVFFADRFLVALLRLWFCWFCLVRNEVLQSLNPKDRERESHPWMNLHRERLFQLLLNCVKLKSVSCTPNLLARTCDSRKCTELLLMLIWSLQGLLQNQSLETIQVCIVVLCFPHNNITGVHMCGVCKRSNAPNFCHELLSITRPHEQICSQKCRHFKTICEQTVDNSPTDPISSSLNWWSSMHGVATLYKCWVVLFASSQYLSTHFFAWPSVSKDHEDIVSASGFPVAFVSGKSP